MKIKEGQEEEYKNWKEKNTDPYGGACLTYAERWADMMEQELTNTGGLNADTIDDLSHQADKEGITGFMYGAAVQFLSNVWVHGEELRQWHNKQYDYEGDGVVNPAVITLKAADE